MPTDDDTEEEELSDELLEIEEVLLDIDETDDEELFGFAGIAGIAGIARLVFVAGVAGIAGVAGVTGRDPDITTPMLLPLPSEVLDDTDAGLGVVSGVATEFDPALFWH